MAQFKDGDSHTVNGVTYVREGGLWHPKASGSAIGPTIGGNPAAELRAQSADQRAAASDARAAAAAAREAAAWNASHNPDGSPKVQAPSLLGNPNLTGAEYLASLPQNIRNRVQQLIDGRSILTAREKGQPLGQQLMDAANQADPSFDENVSHARYTERLQYTGQGKGSQTVMAAKRLAEHVSDLYSASKELGGPDLGWAPLSNLATTTTNSFRQAKVATYKTILPIIQGEIQKLTKNGVATEAEAKEIEASLSANQPEDVRNNAIKELIRLSRAQVEPLRQSWESAWQGSQAPPMPMDFDPKTIAIFDTIEQDGPPLKRDNKGALIVPGSGGNDSPPSVGPAAPPIAPGGGPDYSGMVGPDQGTAATGPTRNIFDQPTAQGMAALIRHGRPYNEAAAFAADHNYPAPDPKAYLAAVAFAKIHGGATNVDVTRSVPTSVGQRLASSPAAGFAVGAGNAASAGFLDEMAGGLSALGGGDYTQSRDAFNAKKHILSDLHPVADLAGNVAGGVGVGLGGEAALGKIAPGVVDLMRASKIAAPASDLAYGSLYGAGENNENRLGGAATGGAAGIGGGMFARAAPKIAGRAIAPDAGAMGPLYEQGVKPTIGQRASAMTGPISSRVGKAVNTVEQAMQSVPILGALPASAREGARKEFQRGAFNDALSELGTQLPKNAGIGPEAHSFASGTFDKAYDTARTGMQFVADPPFTADFAAFDKGLADGTLTKDQAAQVHSALSSSLEGRLKSGGMSGADYKAAVSDIQRKAATWASNPNTSGQAHYLTQFANILDDAARRNSNPAAVALLDAADKGYAKFVRIQKASQLGGAAKDAGTFTPNNFASAVKSMGGGVRSNAYSRGDALGQDYAQAGLKLSDTMPDSGTPGRLATMGLLSGAEGAALATGHLAIGPGALGMFAPYVGKLGNKLVAPRQYTLPPALSQPLNLMGDGLYDRSGAIGRIGAPAAAGYFLGQ